jgi:anti-anti-sigma factor
MEISVLHEKNTACFVIGGDIDENGAEALSHHFRELTTKGSVTELILDFKAVKYIGSSGIGVIILFYKKLTQSGGKIRIKNVSREIHDLLSDLDINKIIGIFQTDIPGLKS